ncbi:group II intron maturase-specific domain-containing protein [Thalassomonas haliotis]|uniref:group II intron maturase-specific domain-containing protein n=1 Tax=Thalassomonas haliotis TaxID=485448 RepID=UPI0023616405|nr:group II intron maturase-specific domain-containing protein [Thalassomonas haliotis]
MHFLYFGDIYGQHCFQSYKLSQYLCGWINYFGIVNAYQCCVELEHWMRHWDRLAYWLKWRKPRTKVRNLIKLGVPIQAAVSCAITRKGSWRSAKLRGLTRRSR